MILLSPAVAAQAPVLAVLHAASFSDAWDTDAIAGLLASPAVFGVVGMAGEGSEAVGFALGQAAVDEAEVLTIAVAPWARRLGAGAALLAGLIQLAAARNVTTMFLEVAADNPAALRLYERFSFQRVGVRPGYYARPHGVVDAAIMRRAISRGSIAGLEAAAANRVDR
jgi:ribosomal-protein-alanine N-acetyltransferase